MSKETLILVAISVALIFGLLSNRLIRLIHLPNVTGYLVVGIILGPCVLGVLTNNKEGMESLVSSLGIIVDVALGFIAFSIGSEFKLSSIKKLGKGVIVITLWQSCAALIAVDVFLTITALIMGKLEFYLPVILTLGAVATATAPAATLMVIKQYKAKGPVTEILLPVVAFDDAVGLMLFSLSFSIAKVFASQNAGLAASVNVVDLLLIPLAEIALSLVVGALIGFVLTCCMKWFKSRANRLMCMLAATFLGVALCELCAEFLHMEMSSLLTCMMIGAVFCNLRQDALMILDGVDRWTPAIFMLFFILSGAELDFTVMANKIVLIICAVYLIARSLGKYFGAMFGSKLEHQNENVIKYLGLTLLPQAGVAIGMARSSSSTLRMLSPGNPYLLEIAGVITAVVLTATLVYELFGPVITKIALTKAGEIPEQKNK